MRWDDFRKSSNVEDRRGQLVRAGGLGLGTMAILGLIAWGLGINPALLIGGAEMVSRHLPSSAQQGKPAGNDEAGQFVAAVLGDTEDQWSAIFKATGKTYQPPKLVMYSGATRSACGMAQAAVGPFDCPNDRTVYLDTAFFKEIETRLRGCETGSKACQFSQAYVIAHEIGHHVQNELGILPKVQALQARSGQTEGNQLQVRVELQADCLAGSGPIIRRKSGILSNLAISRRPCKPQPPSATTRFSGAVKVTLCPTPLRMGPQSSASAGCWRG